MERLTSGQPALPLFPIQDLRILQLRNGHLNLKMMKPEDVVKIPQEYPVSLLPDLDHCNIESYCIDPFKLFIQVGSGQRDLDINSLEHVVCGLRIKAQEHGVILLTTPKFETPDNRGTWSLINNLWTETKTIEEVVNTGSQTPWQQFDNVTMRTFLYVIMMDRFDNNFRGKLDNECLVCLTPNKQTPTRQECELFEELHELNQHRQWSDDEIEFIRSHMELYLQEEPQSRELVDEISRLHMWENLRNFRRLNYEICVLFYLFSLVKRMSPETVWPTLRWATGTYDELEDDDIDELPQWEKDQLRRFSSLSDFIAVNYFFPTSWEENHKHPNRPIAWKKDPAVHNRTETGIDIPWQYSKHVEPYHIPQSHVEPQRLDDPALKII